MAYNFVADTIHKKKLCSSVSSSEVQLKTENSHFAFLAPLGGIGAACDVYLRFIAKRVVVFLLVLIQLLLGVTAEALRANIDQKSAFSLIPGQFDQKFHVEGVAPHQPFFVSKSYYE